MRCDISDLIITINFQTPTKYLYGIKLTGMQTMRIDNNTRQSRCDHANSNTSSIKLLLVNTITIMIVLVSAGAGVAAFAPIPGDLNLDGVVDIVDVHIIQQMVVHGEYSPYADLNADDRVAQIDAIHLLKHVRAIPGYETPLFMSSSEILYGPYLTISNGSAKYGEMTTVTITAYNATTVDVANFDLTITYDPSVVVVTNATINPNLGDLISNFDDNATGSVRIASSNNGSGLSGDVTLVTLSLVANGTIIGETGIIGLTINQYGLLNSSENVISAEVINGTFVVVSAATPSSCDAQGNEKNQFVAGESVYVKGTGLEANTSYRIWIQANPVSEGDLLTVNEDPSGVHEEVTTDTTGNFSTTEIWAIPSYAPSTYDEYDIVIDKLGDEPNTGYYNAASDGIDSMSAAGFVAPVLELSPIILFSAGLIALAGYVGWRRRESN